MKIGVSVAIWKRPEVWEITKSCLSRHDLIVSVSGSEGEKSKGRCDGYIYTEVENKPLGAKVNASVQALRGLVDYVIFIGSDDIFCDKMMGLYLDCIKHGVDYVSFTDCYFINLINSDTLYWKGYNNGRKGEPIGAFKMLSKKILNRIGWQPFNPLLTSSLDNSFHRKITPYRKKVKLFSMKEQGVIGCDMKQSDSLTKFRKWDNSEYIPTDTLKQLPEYNKLINYGDKPQKLYK